MPSWRWFQRPASCDVEECGHLKKGRLRRVYKLVQDFGGDDWEDVSRYHERMTQYYQGKILDIIPTLEEKRPESFAQLELRI